NHWDAIDTPRFNGCIKAGTKSQTAGKMESLDTTPRLFFVLWDTEPKSRAPRCRIWVVRPPSDRLFRAMAQGWYNKRTDGSIRSPNFQLHPPRDKNSNTFRNRCGNLNYPLLFEAHRARDRFEKKVYAPELLDSGECAAITE